ncbi:hypothetical protein [Frigoribacterium sp. UYMn621]|jgi:hypothetical protein|uniref:hypothetical protein n=1 Tax=Frigoribacterium sp. UYMn621 TaxID=3156343 RepID=UPI0033934A37
MTEPVAVTKRPLLVWDIVVSAAVLLIGVGFLVVSAVIDLFSAALVGNCPARTCSAGAAVASLGISWFVMFLLLVIGAVLTIVTLARRRQAWWIALLAIVLVVAVWITGFVLYSQAVSHERVVIDGVVALGSSLLG